MLKGDNFQFQLFYDPDYLYLLFQISLDKFEEDLFSYIITLSKGFNHPHSVAHFAIFEEDLFPFPLCGIDGPGRFIMPSRRGRSKMNLSDEQADHHKPEAHGSDADQME